MISAPITMGSRDGGSTDMTARVCLLRATLAPTSRSSIGTYSEVDTMKSGPVELFTMTLPSARTSLMEPMINGGDFSLSISARIRLSSFCRRKSSLSTYLFSPSTLRISSKSSPFLLSRTSILSLISATSSSSWGSFIFPPRHRLH